MIQMDIVSNKRVELFKLKDNWNLQAKRLKEEYAQLTDEDLKLVTGKDYEVLNRIAGKLNLNRKQVIQVIKSIQEEVS